MGKKSRRKQQVTKLGTRDGNLVDAVMDRDREWFEQHPAQTSYVRPRVPGEFAPNDAEVDGDAVIVTLVAPGVRTRQPGNLTNPNAPDATVFTPDQQWRSPNAPNPPT